MKELVNEYAFQILLLIAGLVAAILGTQARALYKKHVNSEEKEAIANAAVLFVQQVYKELHGADKLEEALDAARVLLEKRGIAFDREEMEILVEAAVGSFNDAFFRDVAEGVLLDDEKDSMLDDMLEDYGEVNTDEE